MTGDLNSSAVVDKVKEPPKDATNNNGRLVSWNLGHEAVRYVTTNKDNFNEGVIKENFD
jgi:hypothetical protein